MAEAEWWKRDEQSYGVWQELTTDDGLQYYFNTDTQETQWEKPEELLSPEERGAGSNWVWYETPDKEFIPALNRGTDGGDVVLELQDGNEVRVRVGTKLEPLMKRSLQRVVGDLTLLDDMSVPLILHCLKRRFEAEKIYTAIGDIIISINPYVLIESLYGRRTILKYRALLEEHRKCEPHVYKPAHAAFGGLSFENGRNQSIIISGESGAGKTEAAKQCLSYIGAVAGSLSGIEKKVFQSNPVLEAFGNAKTIRNNNSSRFGKYVDIAFDKNLQIAGAVTTNYLLEKIRVVKQQGDERNYHIFYQLCYGADRSLKKQLRLGKADDYRLCTQGGCTQIPGMSDRKEFEEVEEAFDVLEIDPKEKLGVYKIVSAILHLGNVEFREKKHSNKDPTATIVSNAPVKEAAMLLDVPANKLEKALMTQVIIDTAKQLNQKGAEDQRDNFCKFVYDKLFDHLVVLINKSMIPSVKVHKKIGILDIFGFEIFTVNSLEQLCINFCNEKLQSLFNKTVFEIEEKIYKEEQIGVIHVPYINNQPILDLIEKTRPMGILASLDEELRKPGGNTRKYKDALDKTWGSNKYFRRGRGNLEFILTHYAGDVCYDVSEFMVKNKDSLSKDLADIAGSCKLPLMKKLFGKAGGMSSRKRKATLCKQFKSSLDTLMKSLFLTQPHYIRCIKPNDEKEALYFVSKNCLEQMTYSGVFEAVKIRKTGFPFRLTHTEFAKRYNCILEEAKARTGKGVAGCKKIVQHLKLNEENIRVGKTKMLYRAEEHSILELKQSVIMEKKRMASTLKEILRENPDTLGEGEKEVYFARVGQTVRSCNRYNIRTPDANKVRELLEVFIMDRMDPSTRELLERALETKNLQDLIEVCDIIEENDYQTEKCQLAVKLRDRILRIQEEALAANLTLEVEHMRAVMHAGAEVGYESDEIACFHELFKNGNGDENTEAFMKAHLKMLYQNVKSQVEGAFTRAMAIEVKLKDRFFANPMFASQFGISNFPGLKDPDDWAGESWSNMFKSGLKDKFMLYTKEKIHTSLTTEASTKELKNIACENLLNVQMFCSDRPCPTGKSAEEFGLNVLTLGFSEPRARDEIFCQIIKQLQMNEGGPYSINQCWKLLNLCLYTFRPSDKLENYLTMFIRENAGEERDHTLKNLQTTIYNRDAVMNAAPTLTDMRDIQQGARARYNFLEEPPQAPTWTDLLNPFDENSPYDYSAPLPGLSSVKDTGPKQTNIVRNSARSRLASMQGQVRPPVFPGAKKTPPAQPGASLKPPPGPNAGPTPPPGPGQSPPAVPSAIKKMRKQKEAELDNTPPIPPPKQPGKGKGKPKPPPETYAWVAHLDADSGDLFYHNEETQETMWDKPAQAIQPFFVARCDDQTGDFYFEDLVGGSTTWDAPDQYCDEQETFRAILDPEGNDYYYENLESGEVTWDCPPCLQAKNEAEWMRHYDKVSSRFYYQNLNTGNVTWDVPPGFEP